MTFPHNTQSSIVKFSLALLCLLGLGYSLQRTLFSRSAESPTHALIQLHPAQELSPSTTNQQTLVLAGGCFWGIEAVFEQLRGVSQVVSGYGGGSANTAKYDLVSTGNTGHAEAVKITYDPQQISYTQLLQVFFTVAHDPTQVGGQGPDHGSQYRSAIFYANSEQQKVAQAYITQINQAHIFSQPIATQLEKLTQFYTAEEYHQNYLDQHSTEPYVVINDLPKLNQLRQHFPKLIKT